jgi:hypothetical protein
MFEMKIECPQCSKIWTVPQGTSDALCNCHLYCEDGDKPSDCSLTPYEHTHTYLWPEGMHLNSDANDDDLRHATYYCATHEKYSYKVPFLIELDWEYWYSHRAPERLRLHRGEV